MSKYIDVEPIIEWAKDPEAQEPYGASGVDWERKIFNAPTIDIDLADDGTLSVEVDDATKVKRVLVEDGESGDLYYADRPQGEWIEHKWIEYNEEFMFEMPMHNYECSKCHSILHEASGTNFCPNCGAKMKGASNE